MTSPVIVALDFDDEHQAFTFVDSVDPTLCRLKVGKNMFTRFGGEFVKTLTSRGFEVFLDLKFHDIPSTVYDAVKAGFDLGAWMVNVHALGGSQMLSSAKKAADCYDGLIIAVTILTSFDEAGIHEIGLSGSLEDNVLHLAKLSHHAGIDGVVCSAQEANIIKQATDKSFVTVTPGIRLESDAKDCQKRVMTPVDAIKNGSDYLVIGRSITKSDAPNKTLKAITESMT